MESWVVGARACLTSARKPHVCPGCPTSFTFSKRNIIQEYNGDCCALLRNRDPMVALR